MNARSLLRRSRATVAARPDIFLANALRAVTATTVVVPRSATSADRLATLPATAPRVVTTVVTALADTVVSVVPVVVNRPATPAVVSATWPGTAPRVRSATTVSYTLAFFTSYRNLLLT